MAKKTYIVDGRQFGSQSDYQDAMADKELAEKIRTLSKGYDAKKLRDLLQKIEKKEIRFRTLLGQDFEDELRERIHKMELGAERGKSHGRGSENASSVSNASSFSNASIERKRSRAKDAKSSSEQEKQLQAAVEAELRKRERIRKVFLFLSGALAICFLGFFGIYSYQTRQAEKQQERLGELIGYQNASGENSSGNNSDPASSGTYQVRLDGVMEAPEILEEYKTIYQQHKKLIGWLKFDDKDIGGKYGFPVMQTEDNEFFLSHNSELKSDKNGAIFLDAGCDVLKPSTNFILYGHHMKSGAMFGNLDHYAKESYWKQYPYFDFDTIYEKGTYQVMYVFRSHVFTEEEVTFKYYQFIDCISATEFDSYMEEMAKLSLYDTGVTAQFGDQLLTLSTCDYQEEAGRFVVVAKKVKSRQ